jgi:hypothetical protein
LLLEIKASGSVLHPSREPLHSTSLWRVKWRQCLVLSRELWSYNWYIDQGEREFFFWRYSIVFILLWPLLKILTHSNLVVIYFLFFLQSLESVVYKVYNEVCPWQLCTWFWAVTSGGVWVTVLLVPVKTLQESSYNLGHLYCISCDKMK